MLTPLSAHASILPDPPSSLLLWGAQRAGRMTPVSEPTHRTRLQPDAPATRRVNQPMREEGLVREGEQPITHERPEEWGWHHSMGKWGRRLTIIPILLILAYLYGNHRGRVEDVWLIAIAVLMVLVLIYDRFRRKNAWRAK
jgi:hypothetical protein